MTPLQLINLGPLMDHTSGRRDVVIGLIDGPVLIHNPELSSENIRELPGSTSMGCSEARSAACVHGTFVAGVLAGKRGSRAPAICPDCTLLVRPIFSEYADRLPSATPLELANAIVETVEAGARVVNLSIGIGQTSNRDDPKVLDALDYASKYGVLIVAAAGNQGTVGSSLLTGHPWVIPVVACDLRGRPTSESNLGDSIGRRGLRAPGEGITSLGTNGTPQTLGGTSVATPFVTGAIGLLWSMFPSLTASVVRTVITKAGQRRRVLVPPLLDAWGAFERMAAMQ